MVATDRPASSTSADGSALGRADVALLVAGVTLLALLARVVLLGDRIAHWDEGRVAYWIVHYQETGSFAYRRIIHGPFVQHVNRWLFDLVGASDFTMRLPVALIGGLLPLSALLFREHLRRAEMVAMALFLSFNPVLLYYSRFMRSDLLVATFTFVAFGLFVRAYDTRRVRYVVAAAAFVALGFTAKENAVVYVMTWLGALGLLADQALFRPRRPSTGYEVLSDRIRVFYRGRVAGWLAATGHLWSAASARATAPGGRDADSDADENTTEDATNGGRPAEADVRRGPANPTVREAFVRAALPFRYVVYLGAAALVFVAILLFFYAPRGAGMAGLSYPPEPATAGAVGFWEAFGSPGLFGQMVTDTWDHASAEFATWFGRATESGSDEGLFSVYVEFLGRFLRVMGTKAAALSGFAVFGFLVERYGAARSRNLVMFAAYGGFVSVIGYPLGTDIFGAWIVVHALVPLSIPAAVGLTRVYDWGREASAADDAVGVGIAVLLLVLVGAQVAAVDATSVYTNDQSNSNYLVQYAQPAGEVRPELDAIAAAGNENRTGADVVLYYGERGDSYNSDDAFVERRDDWNSASLDLHPLCANWFNTLPLPWYLAKDDVDTECDRTAANLTERIETNPPPVVVTQAIDSTVPESALEAEYEGTTYEFRAYGTETTFWVRQDLADE